MKLLFSANLKGRPALYESLVTRSSEFAVMFWLGDLLDSEAGDLEDQHARLERAAGDIQSNGCRVIACGEPADSLDLWRWFDRQGMYVAPGLLITRQSEEADHERSIDLREAAWNAGALWIVLADAPLRMKNTRRAAVPLNSRHDPYAADRFAPDLVVTSTRGRVARGPHAWCERRANTWIITPDAGDPDAPANVVLDFRGRRALRHSLEGRESRELTALFRAPLERTPDDRMILAA